MEQRGTLVSSGGDRRAVPVVVLGVLVGLVPLFAIHPPSDGGPITVGVYLAQATAVVVGLGVLTTGVYSYRTRNLKPAATAATTVSGLVVVIVVGGLIETTGGPLVPLWAWLLAAILAIRVAFAVTNQFVAGRNRTV